MSTTAVDDARRLFGTAFLGPEEIAHALAVRPDTLVADEPGLLAEVPYDRAALEAARSRDELLVFRVPTDGTAPLTMARLAERFPGAVPAALLRGVGYLLKEEWTLDHEPFFARDTCRPEWRLVHREPIGLTRNLSYELQDAALARYATTIGLEGRLRRRTAIEIVFDTILFHATHGIRLLEHTWDWSDTPTSDGGFATAGEFGPEGVHILGYSRAVRFGTLGICGQH